MAPPSRRYGGGRGNFGLLLLAAQVMQIGTNNIPPVTLATVIFNVLIYLGLLPYAPSVHGACTSNHNVLSRKEWPRLLYSSFYHLDDMHLYFNMASFLWKGLTLERQLKSRKFLIMIAMFSVLTQVVMLAINQVFFEIFSNRYYLSSCAAGFSAVCFALKVVTTVNSDHNVSVMGMPLPVPSKYACWVELVLIQLLVPNASFTGHLAGILVGLMYTYGPLARLINMLDSIFSGFQTANSYNYQRGETGYRQQERNVPRNDRKNSYDDDDDDDDERLQQALRESLKTTNIRQQQPERNRQQPPSYGWNIPNDPPPNNYQNLYPDLSNSYSHNPDSYSRHESNPPSAPPFESDIPNTSYTTSNMNNPLYPYTPQTSATNNPPYPVDDDHPPYPIHDDFVSLRPHLHSSNNTKRLPNENIEDAEMIRNARLRKFSKK